MDCMQVGYGPGELQLTGPTITLGLATPLLKCKALLIATFKCVFVTMWSLVMILFSRNYIKAKID